MRFIFCACAFLAACEVKGGNMDAENMRDIIFGWQAVDSVANVKRGISYGEKISIPVDWTSKSFIFEKNGYKTNGFIFLDNVVREYILTKDQELMTILKAYVADWIRQNPSYVAKTWPWYDDAIGRRVQRMSYYYSEFGECFDAGEIAELRRSLDMQAHVLLDDSCYRFKHNHGMFMDLALICYALLVCDDSAFKEQCLDKACERMLAYFEYVFTDDGVHKEHSPSYAREVSHVAAVVSRVMMDVRPRFANSIFKYGECASKWLTALTMPNGVHPSIGDSPYLKYDALPPEDVVFKHGGYAVFRSSWTDPADVATWILFMAATHNGTHKHSDDLSFLLYHGGDLIVEAGYRNYNFLDPDTAYAYSGYGHNVLCVNDNEFPVKIHRKGFRAILPDALKTRIMDSDVSGGVKTVTGRQERFSNVVQQRTLRYDKTRKVVEIDDVLEAKEALKATLIFHLAPGIAVLQTGDKLQFFRGDVLVATMSIASESEFSVRTLLANEADSPYRTSIFVNNLTMKDGPTVLVDVKCDKGGVEFCRESSLKIWALDGVSM